MALEARVQEYASRAEEGPEMAEQAAFEAMEDPHLHVFGELLDASGVRQLRSSGQRGEAVGKLLEIFCFGTLGDYRRDEGKLPGLSEAQLRKLKRLTAVSMALSAKRLDHEELMRELEFGTIREVEDFLINDCIGPGLLTGLLDQERGCFEPDQVIGRDVRSGEIAGVAEALRHWRERVENAVKQAEEGKEELNSLTATARYRDEELHKKQESIKHSLQNKGAHDAAGDTQEDRSRPKHRRR